MGIDLTYFEVGAVVLSIPALYFFLRNNADHINGCTKYQANVNPERTMFNITTEVAKIDADDLRLQFPKLPNPCEVWVIKVSMPVIGTSRMGITGQQMLNREMSEAIEKATLNIPKYALILHEWPLRGIDPEDVDLAIKLYGYRS